MERMQGSKPPSPYSLLGKRLKAIREKRHESLAETSGAVEIDVDMLERIECGDECPSEELLMLLINHFGVREYEAVELWEWAGYGVSNTKSPTSEQQAKAVATVLVALDVRAVYSDGVNVAANESGVIVQFTQSGSQQIPIARVGMSYEQAERVVRCLEQAMLRHTYGPKLPPLSPGATRSPS